MIPALPAVDVSVAVPRAGARRQLGKMPPSHDQQTQGDGYVGWARLESKWNRSINVSKAEGVNRQNPRNDLTNAQE